MADPPDSASLWKTSRTAIATTLIAIALNPISIVLGYYLGQSLRAPRLKIEYVTIDAETILLTVDDSALSPVRQNTMLATSLGAKLPYSCRGWLKEGKISEDCVTPAIQSVEELLEQASFEERILTDNVKALEKWDGESELILRPIVLPQMIGQSLNSVARQNKETASDILKSSLSSTKDRIDEIKKLHEALRTLSISGTPKRTGKVSLQVGVLNSGGSDGVIFPEANLKFVDTSIVLHRGKDRTYTVVKSHSFEELNLTVDEGGSKKDALEKWRGLVKNHQQESFVVALKGSSESLQISGRLPP